MAETYVTIIGSAVGNERDGFRVAYDWDRQHFATKAQAVSNGFRLRESDDFNVGVMNGGRLASLWWMDHKLDEDDATLAEISQECGLTRG
jgi:hypothetical protein